MQIHSKLLKDSLEAPKNLLNSHLINKAQDNKDSSVLKIEDIVVVLLKEGGVIKEGYFFAERPSFKSAYVDCLINYLVDKPVNEFNPREFHHYLREENHIPALEDEQLVEPIFRLFKGVFATDKSPIVCTCHKISYREIENYLRTNPSIEGLSGKLEVGNKCGSCLNSSSGNRDHYVEDIKNGVEKKILNQYYDSPAYLSLFEAGHSSLGEIKNAEATISSEFHGKFQDLSLSKKMLFVQQVFDAKVRPFLQQDGGDLELADIDEYDVFIEYSGACGGCASSSGGTLQFITQTLIEEFQDNKINVIVDQ